jgi:hypothetical protein
VQSQRGNEEEKDNHDSQVCKKVQGKCGEFLFLEFKPMHEQGNVSVPQSQSGNQVKQSEQETNHERPKEKVSEKNNLVVFHDLSVVSNGVVAARLSRPINVREFMKSMGQLTPCESAK